MPFRLPRFPGRATRVLILRNQHGLGMEELVFGDPPGPYIVKGNITPQGVLNNDDIVLGSFDDANAARRFAVKVQTEGMEICGMNIVFIAAWIEAEEAPDSTPEVIPAPS